LLFPSFALVAHDDAHGAGGAGDHAHGRLDAGRVQVRHLGLGDLADILLADGGHLGLVGHTGAGLDVARLLDENGRGGRRKPPPPRPRVSPDAPRQAVFPCIPGDPVVR